MRPLTDFSVPRSPHPQPFKENSFLLSIQMAVCQSQFVGNFHAARRSGDAAQARFAQRNIHLVPDVLLDTCSRSCRENIREDQAVKEALDTPFNKIQKSAILTEMGKKNTGVESDFAFHACLRDRNDDCLGMPFQENV